MPCGYISLLMQHGGPPLTPVCSPSLILCQSLTPTVGLHKLKPAPMRPHVSPTAGRLSLRDRLGGFDKHAWRGNYYCVTKATLEYVNKPQTVGTS